MRSLYSKTKKLNYCGEELDVGFVPMESMKDSRSNPGSAECKKGDVLALGAHPLEADMIIEYDAPLKLPDGRTFYSNIFRPAGEEKIPAIVIFSTAGKDTKLADVSVSSFVTSVPHAKFSSLERFMTPDPAYWTARGYAVAVCDMAGVGHSDGDLTLWDSAFAADGADVIDVIASMPWCDGKIAVMGLSVGATSALRVACACPEKICAAALWEPVSDLYRDVMFRGGIPDLRMYTDVFRHVRGGGMREDMAAMAEKYPYMNAYWRDKIADAKKMTMPVYMSLSYPFDAAIGAFGAYRRIASDDKYVRIHPGYEWTDFYDRRNSDDLAGFFDHYIKGADNAWEKTAKVRMAVLDQQRTRDRALSCECDVFPPDDLVYEKLYLEAASGAMKDDPIPFSSKCAYVSDDNSDKITFTYTFPADTRISGFLKLRVWMCARNAADMDVFVNVAKLDKKGKRVGRRLSRAVPSLKNVLPGLFEQGLKSVPLLFYSGPSGKLRASARSLDPEMTKADRPFYAAKEAAPVAEGEIFPMEIAIAPTAMFFHRGEKLRVTVSGFDMSYSGKLFGAQPPATVNSGVHLIYSGRKYDSYLLIPTVETR